MKMGSPLFTEILSHLLTVGGFLLAVFLIARLMSEKRQPGNTMAWLLVIVLIPYVGVPLYLLLGGRKLRRLAARKSRLSPVPSDAAAVTSAVAAGPSPRPSCAKAGAHRWAETPCGFSPVARRRMPSSNGKFVKPGIPST